MLSGTPCNWCGRLLTTAEEARGNSCTKCKQEADKETILKPKPKKKGKL